MKLYRIQITSFGSHEWWRAQKAHLIGVTTIARASRADALKKYNALNRELAGLPYRIRLDLVTVPDRPTKTDWIHYLETEAFDLDVVEVLRDHTFRSVA